MELTHDFKYRGSSAILIDLLPVSVSVSLPVVGAHSTPPRGPRSSGKDDEMLDWNKSDGAWIQLTREEGGEA